jgi:hypothetical protein
VHALRTDHRSCQLRPITTWALEGLHRLWLLLRQLGLAPALVIRERDEILARLRRVRLPLLGEDSLGCEVAGELCSLGSVDCQFDC